MYRIRCFHRVRQSVALVVVLVALLVVTMPVSATPATDGELGPNIDINGFVWTPVLSARASIDGEKGVGMGVNGARLRVR